MPQVIITGHRGMGITAKRRDHFIDGAYFFPENSIAAFLEAIKLGADALECDIHVSTDNIAMVIHGEKLRDYAYEIDAENQSISNSSDRNRVATLDAYTLSNRFRLKTFLDVEQQLITLNVEKIAAATAGNAFQVECLSKQIDELWEEYSQIEPAFTHIPTLEQLLEVCALENNKRAHAAEKLPPLKLNIELKGVGSGHITLETIAQYNKKARHSNGLIPEIDPSDIILLGRTSIGEIVTAKSLLIGAQKFLDDTDGMTQKEFKKNKHALLQSLMGTQEHVKVNGKIPQALVHTQIAQKIIQKYSQDNGIKKGRPELETLRDFLTEICALYQIRTNVMLSTGDLYGTDALLDNEDFDLKSDINTISPEGQALITQCIVDNHYDGIDISLFDFEIETCRALIPAIQQSKDSEKKSIMGATASNWKGVVSENSPILPAEAILKAHWIVNNLGVDIILKVDEPGFFKELYRHILNEEFTLMEPEEIEISFETITITGHNSLEFSSLGERNYDVSAPIEINPLSNNRKPPRGERKSETEEQLFEFATRRLSLSDSWDGETENPIISIRANLLSPPPLSFSFGNRMPFSETQWGFDEEQKNTEEQITVRSIKNFQLDL